MLKIKDNVNLKELEKFGFKKEKEEEVYTYYDYLGIDADCKINMYVSGETREIATEIDEYVNSYEMHDEMYDLITAGLVEKVEEEEI